MIRPFIILNMLLILYFLVSSLKHLMKEPSEEQQRLAVGLSRRIMASFLLFFILILFGYLGWIK